MRASVVQGHFTGCLKDLDWSLADGSIFLCHDTWRVDLFDPRVLLLQTQPDQTYVLLIAGHAYNASMVRLGDRPLGTPLSLQTVLDAPAQPPSGEPPDDRISPIGQVYSINQLRDQDHLLLNAAQRYRPFRPDENPQQAP